MIEVFHTPRIFSPLVSSLRFYLCTVNIVEKLFNGDLVASFCFVENQIFKSFRTGGCRPEEVRGLGFFRDTSLSDPSVLPGTVVDGKR